MQKVCFELESGEKINVELYPEYAPLSVENFVSLVKDGFYDGLCFHRVIEGFMIQGGGFKWENGLVHKDAPRTVKGEFAANGIPNGLKHTLGVLSMARTQDKNSASSQFFICSADTPHLDGQYAAFGKVCDEEGIKNVLKISGTDTGSWQYYSDVPTEPIVIKHATLI